MTVTDEQIVTKFAEVEKAHGGPRKADTQGVLRETATLLGVTYDRARTAMLNAWGMRA